MLSSYLNGSDWTKQFISKILQITHSQWICRNIPLHDKHQGYLHNKQLEGLLKKISKLSKLTPEDVPTSSQFLLEINFTILISSHINTQKYWTLAVKSVLNTQDLEAARGARTKRIC
jgi:hypothetical protein